jgi:hypothetical protein
LGRKISFWILTFQMSDFAHVLPPLFQKGTCVRSGRNVFQSRDRED